MKHVFNCFTYGKPVRRVVPLIDDEGNRLDEIKRRFNRVGLIRQFFAINKADKNRKFIFPVDSLGLICSEKHKRADF